MSVYVGNGGGGLTPPLTDPVPNANLFLEWWVHSSAQHFEAALDAAGVPSHYVDYGDGIGSAWADCHGHNGLCWSHDLDDLLPRLRQALGAV